MDSSESSRADDEGGKTKSRDVDDVGNGRWAVGVGPLSTLGSISDGRKVSKAGRCGAKRFG